MAVAFWLKVLETFLVVSCSLGVQLAGCQAPRDMACREDTATQVTSLMDSDYESDGTSSAERTRHKQDSQGQILSLAFW